MFKTTTKTKKKGNWNVQEFAKTIETKQTHQQWLLLLIQAEIATVLTVDKTNTPAMVVAVYPS